MQVTFTKSVRLCVDGRGIKTQQFSEGEVVDYTDDKDFNLALEFAVQNKWAKATKPEGKKNMGGAPENKTVR